MSSLREIARKCAMLCSTASSMCYAKNKEQFSFVPLGGGMMLETQNNSLQERASMTETEQESIFSDFDLYLFGQGKHYHLYDKMGAHPRVLNGVAGTHFATWAPNAQMISVIGDFNQWNRSANQMWRRHNDLGVW